MSQADLERTLGLRGGETRSAPPNEAQLFALLAGIVETVGAEVIVPIAALQKTAGRSLHIERDDGAAVFRLRLADDVPTRAPAPLWTP